MKAVIALALKDLRLLIRDRSGFFFTFFFPFLMAIFFGMIFSGGNGEDTAMKILVVDEDNTTESAEFITLLADSPELSVEKTMREKAVQGVRLGKVPAYIVIPEGFGAARSHIFQGDPPRLKIGVDPSHKAETGMLEGILTKYAVQGFQKAFSNPELMRDNIRESLKSIDEADEAGSPVLDHLKSFLTELDKYLNEKSLDDAPDSGGFNGFQPIVIEKEDIRIAQRGPKNYYAVSFPQGVMWGLLACASAFSMSLVTERRTGTLMRLLVASISRRTVLTGKALACFVTSISISTLLFLFARVVFGIVPASVPLLALAVICSSAAFVGIMMFLSVLGKTEQATSGISWAILLVMSMIGGGMIPLFALPGWLKTLSHFSPVKWAILSFEGAIWRGFTPMEMLRPCGILLVVGVVFFSIGVRAFNWNSGE